MASLAWVLLSILAHAYVCEAYKVLVVFPMPGKSHGILGGAVVKHLLNYGYEVTYITPFVEKHPHPNLNQVDVSSNLMMMPKESLDMKSLIDKKVTLHDHPNIMFVTNLVAAKTIENENVQKLLNDTDQKFDLVIFEWIFSELITGIAAVYDVPFVWLCSLEPHWIITRLVDESLNPAYNSDSLSNNIPPLSFHQRVEELWIQIKTLFHIYTYNDEKERKEYERLIAPIILKKGRQPPSFDELKYNGSLVLGNSHVSLGQATRIPQNYKPIGGYHVEEDFKRKPLPRKLQQLMDNAEDGVIYFSMGSNLNSKDMPEDVKKSLLEMFGGLKQTVLWKFEEKSSDTPENVRLLNWAPQQSILAHKNCVLFITHGGLLSITETVHFGVPIIGIPVFADQFINIDRAVNRGFAKKVDLSYALADDLKLAIEEVLNNSSYTEKVKELSFIYHDRPMQPGAELRHWVEHVIVTRGAPHLRSPAIDVPWYQKTFMDLAAVVVTVLIIVILIVKLLSMVLSKKKIDSSKKMK